MLKALSGLLRQAITPNGAGGAKFDPRSLLQGFEKAEGAYDDPVRHRVWACGRGAAKTTTAQLWLLSLALTVANCSVVYISNTKVRAKAVAWRDFLKWNREFKLGGKPNGTDLTIEFPNGAMLFVTGADSPELFDRKRGIKNVLAAVFDEAQDWESSTLEYAVTKVFLPRLGDLEKETGLKGRLIVCGTGTRDAGFFYKIFSDRSMGWSARRWTQWDNPHIHDPQGEYQDACQAAGVDPNDPDELTRREWKGEFNSGGILQIFRLALGEPSPTLVPRSSIPEGRLTFVVGADFGTIDAAACAVWAFTSRDPNAYLIESTKEYGLSSNEQVKFVRGVKARYREKGVVHIVGDGGGLGKALILDLQAAEKFHEVDPAEKQDKIPNIRLMAGDLRRGYVKIADTEKAFVETLKLPEWHPDHVGERIRGHMPDEIDAAYMGFRRVKELHRYQPPEPQASLQERREAWQREKERPQEEW